MTGDETDDYDAQDDLAKSLDEGYRAIRERKAKGGPGWQQGGQIQQFDPERYSLNQAALDYGIEHAKRIKSWPELEKAVDLKIEEQHKFVAWWDANVRGAGGKEAQAIGQDRGQLARPKAENLTGMKHQRVSDLGKRLRNELRYRERLLGAEFCAAFLSAVEDVRGTGGTGENEWFTPAEYIEMARTVLGEIDLDPATHERAQETVRAAQFYTKADNGLRQEWHGRVWLNPPYAQPHIAEFVSKMCAERKAGRVTAGIMLTHNYTDTAWFHEAAAIADAICFTRGRVKFYEPDGAIAAPTQGQAFFYFGNDVALFESVFVDVGFVVVPWMPK